MAEGFSSCRFTSARLDEGIGDNLRQFVELGHHGEMGWIKDTLERRLSPEKMWLEAKTAIVLAMNYGPKHDPLEITKRPKHGAISVYAQNRDYHNIIKGKLKTIAGKIAAAHQADVKVFVDTAPLMEKPLAAKAGAGWQGKHTNLVSREFGSWLFLGIILTNMEIAPDQSETDHCGKCNACLDACPTNAIIAPYRIDARRCISYLTIEHKSTMPRHLRPLIGNRIYGCDDCLAVCPWNKYAKNASEAKLKARDDLIAPGLEELAGLDDTDFRKKFSASPVKRIGHERFMRNVLIAIGNSGGNSGSAKLARSALPWLDHASPILRGTAIWALARLLGRDEFAVLYAHHHMHENDKTVKDEWQLALAEHKETAK